jgi:hypothetical protein
MLRDALSESGYSVIGLDRDASALDIVRQASNRCDRSGPETVLGDMRAFPVRSSSLYHRVYYERAVGRRRILRGETEVTEIRTVEDDRLRVTLIYAGYEGATETDNFEWHLYSPDELATEAAEAGLKLHLACTEFDETRSPTNDCPRMQVVFARSA